MVREKKGAGVAWRHKVENEQWDKFVHENWILKMFKQVIKCKDAFYSFEISKIEQQ